MGFTPEDYEPRLGFPLRANENGIRFKQEKDDQGETG